MKNIFFVLFVSLFLFCFKADVVFAGTCSGCQSNSIGNVTLCDSCVTQNGSTQNNVICGPGYYPCSRNCCAVGGTCFLPGTKVKTPTGEKKIEDIKVGDKVASFVDDKVTESTVSQIYERQRDYYYSLVADDYSVKASAEHPFYVGGGKSKEIQYLVSGDIVFVFKDWGLKKKKVTSNTRVDEKTPVYNMTVDNTHTFFADDFAVHNKGCFVPGTIVDSKTGGKKIEDIKIGDMVSSFDETGKVQESRVSNIFEVQREYYFALTAGDYKVEATAEHPFYVGGNEYKEIQYLVPGDKIYIKKGETLESKVVQSNIRIDKPTKAYNLTVDNTHTFFANQIAVHNKGCPCGYGAEVCTGGGKNGSPLKCSSPCKACCATTAPSVVSLTTPLTNTVYVASRSGRLQTTRVFFDWQDTTTWGNECSGTTRRYDFCFTDLRSASDPCVTSKTSVSDTNNKLSPPSQLYYDVDGFGVKNWAVKAVNKSNGTSVISEVRKICIEGFRVSDRNYVSPWSNLACGNHTETRTCREDCGTDNCAAISTSRTLCTECGPRLSDWSACSDVTHTRTRTCSEDCGTNNCSTQSLVEACEARVTGTLFDATDLDVCPNIDPATGYMVRDATTRSLGISGRTFGLTDVSSTGLGHPWTLPTSPSTDTSGNFSALVYPKASYQFNFAAISDRYDATPKLVCTATGMIVNVSDNDVKCNTQPCTVVKGMLYGLTRYQGGWWQTKGAGAHAEKGLKSNIPETATSPVLIQADDTAAQRTGVLSYGSIISNMIGSGTNTRVSSKGWAAQNNYAGLVYDYAFYNQQLKKYVTANWDGSSAISYDDGGRGYQIFKVSGAVSNFAISPTGTQKMIFLVNGDVKVTSNITVPNGAFLAIIANGTIGFETNVTNADGWYLGNVIEVKCADVNGDTICDKNDSQFLGNGSFVGWKGINLSRDRGDLNNTMPSSLFTYRLDLYNNAPDPIKVLSKGYKQFAP